MGILMVLSKHGGREGHLAWQETRVFLKEKAQDGIF
jgi:hypothetical protein